ncbi:anti-sigma factor [Kribbella sp. CA-253562]|uniref:anti-sigma factor n=1 Tax=Kribbella sp. CA-253562 TaxID=3239942 RepID=UPI003D8B4381
MDEKPDMGSMNGQVPPVGGMTEPDPSGIEELLRRSEVWAAVPAELEQRVMAEIREASDHDVPEVEAGNVVPLRRHSRAGRLRFGGRVGLVAAGIVAVAAAGIGLTVADRDETHTVALAGTPLEDGARGRVELRDTASGVEISLSTTGLPPAPAGSYYQGWVKGARGSVPIGTFHLRDGVSEIILWSGVDLTDYPTISVTLESESDGPESSGQVMLSGLVPTEFR